MPMTNGLRPPGGSTRVQGLPSRYRDAIEPPTFLALGDLEKDLLGGEGERVNACCRSGIQWIAFRPGHAPADTVWIASMQ
jgi:hypothetical protein